MSTLNQICMLADDRRFCYQVELIRALDGVSFGLRTIPDAWLEPAREQTIFQGQRRGHLSSDVGGVGVLEQPVYSAGADLAGASDVAGLRQIRGLRMIVGDHAAQSEKAFGLDLFEPFASAVAADLVATQQIDADEHVLFKVFAHTAEPAVGDDGVVAHFCREPLVLHPGRLDEWMAVALPDGPISQEEYPLFLLENEVLEAARESCWLGKEAEGGCWLVGNLYRQTGHHPELYGVLHAVVPAVGCSHGRFGLSLSSETYVHLQDRLDRRRRHGWAGELAMGFCHSHPFSPSELFGHDACVGCDKRDTCDLSSAFLSGRDAQFHRAVFGRSPYSVQLVLGLTARDAFDMRAYHLDGGQFRRRGFYRVAKPPKRFTEMTRSRSP
jgi:hypothetical protein